MWDFTGVTLRHGDAESPGEGGVIVVRPPLKPPSQPRRMLTLDVHDAMAESPGPSSAAKPNWNASWPASTRPFSNPPPTQPPTRPQPAPAPHNPTSFSLPLVGRVGVGSVGGQGFLDCGGNAFQVLQNVGGQETQGAESLDGEDLVTHGVVGGLGFVAVVGAVDLDDQAVGVGHEIQDVAAKRCLAAEMMAFGAEGSEVGP